ncbi:hypothetical protein LZF95_07450 [Algoriphagus sp. AGSA1]|uniref:hypothetical protein n=1 Tax=Algoriphagus sp. AGSA1 TaxID=2907213 RepID=UPI001F458BA3|nr:hypothetical protein [Algoriphagus sp. AGSA1]MCE7054503.1 hypothetical protein [Algoriphagus sp. AGSA1]
MIHKENIVYKDQQMAEAAEWINSREGQAIIAQLSRSYHFKTVQIEERPQIHVLNSKYARGFAVSYDEPLDEQTFSLLFLALAQRVLALGYRKVSLDRKMEEINEQVKITDKFYFKPPLTNLKEKELIPQLFGRITIEKITVNNQPNYLKVLATFYSDRLYHDPEPFDQFLDHLFEVTNDGQS